MAGLAGKGGLVKIGSNVVAEIDEWQLEIDTALLDDTVFTSGGVTWKSVTPGLNSAKVSLKGKYAVTTDTNGQAAIQSAALNQTSVALDLSANGGTNNYSIAAAYVSKLPIDAKIADLITFDADFEVSGAVTYS